MSLDIRSKLRDRGGEAQESIDATIAAPSIPSVVSGRERRRRRTFQPAQKSLKDAMREINVMARITHEEPAVSSSVAIGVTSPHFGDGKTTVSIALAGSISQDYGAEVMLVDGDLHTHSMGAEFDLIDREGLWEIVTGRQTLEQVTHRVARANMNVVTAGKTPEDPARMARSEHLISLIENMKQANEYIVIDLPAALHSMNTPVLAQRCDGVIVVVRAGHTLKNDLERTLHLLRDTNVLGVVINRYKSRTPGWVQRALSLRG